MASRKLTRRPTPAPRRPALLGPAALPDPPPREVREEAFKDELLAVLAHELRTPLTVVAGVHDLLADGVAGGMNAAQQAYLDAIGVEIERLLSAISSVIEASSLTAGVLRLETRALDLGPIARDVLATLAPRAEARGVQLSLSLPPGLPHVRADQERVAQVLCRLLENAIAFSPRGCCVVLRCLAEPAAVRVEVTDAGSGIGVCEQSRLFRRFGQLDGSSTREHGGLGMGLFLARRLVEAQGGRMGLTSAPGAGSLFWFTLPACSPQALG